MKSSIRHHIRKLKQEEFLKILTLRTIGNFLVLSSLFMIGKTFYQPIRQEVRYFVEKSANKQYLVAATKQEQEEVESFHLQQNKQAKGALNSLLKVDPVEVLVPEDPEFSIVIPKIGANAKVLPGIDVSNEGAYLEALQKGVAHAGGTAFPGEGGHIFMFAHSTDYFWNVGSYNAVFYLLHKLNKDDEINVFYKGQRYVYRIVEKAVVDPSQVEYLTRKTDREFLTLQTCWPPGTTLKRLLVFAIRVSE